MNILKCIQNGIKEVPIIRLPLECLLVISSRTVFETEYEVNSNPF